MATTNSDTVRLNQIVDSGLNIYGSRERIRENLVTYAKRYLNISDDSDISKASYLAYLIDMLSILSSNQVYYQSKLYNEFFIVTAVMNESVQNLAKWIGYTIPKAVCSTLDVMFTIPLSFTSSVINFNFSKYFKLYAGGIPFTIKSNNNLFDQTKTSGTVVVKRDRIPASQGKIVNNSAVTVRDYNGFYRPVYIDKEGKTCSFNLTFEQCTFEIQTFQVPSDLKPNQFFQKNLEFDGQVSEMLVYVCSPTSGQSLNVSSTEINSVMKIEDFDPSQTLTDSSGQLRKFELWTECVNGIYTISSNKQQYDWLGYYNRGVISFGNGVLGKQPTAGSLVVCCLKLTQGANGNIINNAIGVGDDLTLDIGNGQTSNIEYSVYNNNAAYGGVDILSTSELKNNAIINLKARKRLVTDDDYNNITDVVTETTLTDCTPILKRSDIKINDISLYFILNYYNDNVNNIVPTRNVTIDLIDPQWNDEGKLRINKNYMVTCGPANKLLDFSTIFNITCNKNTRMASYDYTCTEVDGVATELYSNSVFNSLTQSCYLEAKNTKFNIDSSTVKTVNSKYPVYIKLSVNHIANKQQKTWNGMTSDKTFDDFDHQWTVDEIIRGFHELTHFKCMMVTKWGEDKSYDDTSDGYTVEKETKETTETVTEPDSDDGKVMHTVKRDFSETTYKSFTFMIDDYTEVPDGKQRFEFYLLTYAPKKDSQGNIKAISCKTCQEIIGITSDGSRGPDANANDKVIMEWQIMKKYYSDVILTQDLSSCMQSSITVDNYVKGIPQGEDEYGNKIKVYHIHEVPTIYKKYYDDVMTNYTDFEATVMQKLLENINFSNKRMMSDFTNIKFADTYGTLSNLRYNPCTYEVESRYKHTPWWRTQQGIDANVDNICIPNPEYDPPSDSDPLIYYVINGRVDDFGKETPVSDYMGYIALRIPSLNSDGTFSHSYSLIQPTLGDIIKIKDELDSEGYEQTCVWNGRNWVDVEQYSIPLEVKIKIQIDEQKVSKSDDELKKEVIETLSKYYNDGKMGLQKQLDRSEIIRVCRSINGVEYVEVYAPEFDVKFDYEISKLKQIELLNFTPQYVGFRTVTDTNTDYTNTSIDIEIIRS